MNRLILQSTSLAQWYKLVNEAEDYSGKHLNIDLESYLVYLLEKYTNKPELTGSILALDYLNSLEASGKLRTEKLREVGDKCLLFSGFFPELAHKRHVTVSYFVDIGRRAYSYLSRAEKTGVLTSSLYSLLMQQFVPLLDMVFAIRDLSGEEVLTLLQAEDLWRNAGSHYALQTLKKYNKDVIALKNYPLNKVH